MTAPTEPRRTALARAAFELIAERGLEGLRTRDVAARVGVNIATLHYYFATKDALLAGVADHLIAERAARRAGTGSTNIGGPLERLRREFAQARYARVDRPALHRVALELSLRAERDPILRSILAPREAQWRASLEAILADGARDGTLRADLAPVGAASMVAAVLRGAAPDLDGAAAGERFDAACAELERALAAR